MRKLHDKFFKQAKREGKLARSVYKLEELNKRERLIHKGDRVLDVGAAPGSWLEHIVETIGPDGVACAIDLKPIHKKFKTSVHFKKMDIRDVSPDTFADVVPDGFNAIVSDMAPNTSGIRIVDQARSLELCECVFDLALRRLKKHGNFACKIFYGPETEQFKDKVAKHFKTAKIRKPDACRNESIETYVLGLDFQG